MLFEAVVATRFGGFYCLLHKRFNARGLRNWVPSWMRRRHLAMEGWERDWQWPVKTLAFPEMSRPAHKLTSA